MRRVVTVPGMPNDLDARHLGAGASPAVVARLARYTPRVLDEAKWALAADAVRDVAARTEPADERRAQDVAWALCVFLARPCGWLHDGPPSLELLLNRQAINDTLAAHIAAGGRSAVLLRRHLMAAARTVAGTNTTAVAPARRPGPCPRLATWLDDTAVVDIDMPEGVARRAAQRALEAHAASARFATAVRREASMVERTYTARILRAGDQRSTEAVQATVTPTAKKAPRTSMRAQMREAKANRDAYKRALAGPVLAPATDLDTLPAPARDALKDYFPRGMAGRTWAELRPLTLRLVAGTHPATASVARSRASAVVRFLAWLRDQPHRIDPAAAPSAAEVLAPDVTDAYLAQLRRKNRPAASIATTGSHLRCAVKALDAQPLSVPARYSPLRPPYSPEECDAIVELVTVQPSKGRRRVGALIVGLALGAGLASKDLRHLRASDVAEQDGDTLFPYLTVTVPAGQAPRTVVIRDAYAPLVRRGLALHNGGPDSLLIGHFAGRHNVNTLTMTTADNTPIRLDIARLRTTWLFAMMHVAIPLPRLLADAGLTTAHTLADLLPYIERTPARDLATARAVPAARRATSTGKQVQR